MEMERNEYKIITGIKNGCRSMYFLNIEALKSEIKNDNLKFKSFVNYFVWWIVLLHFSEQITQHASTPIPTVVFALSIIALHAVCLYWCSKSYRGSDPDSFFKLFFPIAWVVTWRISIVLGGVLFFWLFISSSFEYFSFLFNYDKTQLMLFDFNETQTTVLTLIIGLGLRFLYYWRISIHLGELSNTETN
jgi:hypothetical protein